MMVGHGFIRHAQHEDKPRRRPAANRGASDVVVVVDRAPGAGRPAGRAGAALLADTSFLRGRPAASRRDRRGTGSEGNDGASCSPLHGPGVQGLAVRPVRLHMDAGMALSFSLALSSQLSAGTDDATGGGTCLTMMGLGRSREPAANHVREWRRLWRGQPYVSADRHGVHSWRKKLD